MKKRVDRVSSYQIDYRGLWVVEKPGGFAWGVGHLGFRFGPQMNTDDTDKKRQHRHENACATSKKATVWEQEADSSRGAAGFTLGHA